MTVSQGTSGLGTARRRALRLMIIVVRTRRRVRARASHRHTTRVGGCLLLADIWGRWNAMMRLCASTCMRFRRGGRLKFSPGRPDGRVFFAFQNRTSLTIQDSPRHTCLACAWQPVSLSGAHFATIVQKTNICRGDGACSMLCTILIPIYHNHMASHIVENLMLE